MVVILESAGKWVGSHHGGEPGVTREVCRKSAGNSGVVATLVGEVVGLGLGCESGVNTKVKWESTGNSGVGATLVHQVVRLELGSVASKEFVDVFLIHKWA